MHELRTQRRIEFADTDMAGIVHFARFFVFMESAEHELLRALGVDILSERDGRQIGWPRVAAACEYLSPARFGDLLDIHLTVARKGHSSLTYAFAISRDGTPVARGRVTAVCCVLDDPAGVRAIRIPAALAERLEEARGD